jgi:predicted DNA-binding protein (UPF0251 family)
MPGRRGRCRRRRWIHELPMNHPFSQPYGQLIPNSICLTFEEIEIIRLIDLENMTQQEAASQLRISRKTLWNDLQRIRRKVAHAIVHGHPISIAGIDYKYKNEKEV